MIVRVDNLLLFEIDDSSDSSVADLVHVTSSRPH